MTVQQSGSVRVLRPAVEVSVARGASSTIRAGIHHQHAVGEAGQRRQVVGHPDHGHARCAPGGRLTRSTISAWTVTSSAVVGSSAMRRRGPRGERHGDHDALAHPARELVRKLVDADRGIGDADVGQQLDDPLAAPRPRSARDGVQ